MLTSIDRRVLPALVSGLLVVAGVCLSGVVARADIIELKTGQKIEGEVLKDTGGELIVDLGVDIVKIPVTQVKSRQSGNSGSEAAPETKAEKSDLYSTADLPVRTIKELSQKFGEGVVLVQTPGGLGSGFILDDRGYCVTNYHVIERETRIAVTIYHRNDTGEFVRRRIDDVAIVAINPFFDLALLQIPVQKDLKFQHVFLARHNDAREGDDVFAIGNPLGLERSVSQGIISTRNRSFEGQTFIQTTAEINPGNSGGPLFNLKGEVVGVISMKLLRSEGLGFAIPMAYVKHFLDNREAFAFDKNNANTGHRYLEAPRRKTFTAVPAPAESAEPARNSDAPTKK
ncbi:MAG: trypsin-like serine protease [Planctomycetaceae bacterium]|nr:trypsin-like serine protease [Planctomycetaceae bacterium]